MNALCQDWGGEGGGGEGDFRFVLTERQVQHVVPAFEPAAALEHVALAPGHREHDHFLEEPRRRLARAVMADTQELGLTSKNAG